MSEIKRYICRHIHVDGRRCGSPSLTNEHFCYYHHESRKPVADVKQRRARANTFELPNPENRAAIQQGIGEVLRRIASGQMDPKRAGLLLYGFQIASLNLPPHDRDAKPEDPVSDVILDEQHGKLAPIAEVGANPNRGQTLVEYLKSEMARRKAQEEAEKHTMEREATGEVITTLQACAAPGRVPHLRRGFIAAKVGHRRNVDRSHPSRHNSPRLRKELSHPHNVTSSKIHRLIPDQCQSLRSSSKRCTPSGRPSSAASSPCLASSGA